MRVLRLLTHSGLLTLLGLQAFVIAASTQTRPTQQICCAAAVATVRPVVVGANDSHTTAADPVSPQDVVIGDGDLLQVSMYDVPEFNEEARVTGAGEISLPMLGSVKVAGLTTKQAEILIERRLIDSGYFINPHISVFQKEFATQGMSVLGEVQKPGIYPMIGAHRLFDAISAAGGITPKAGRSVVIAHRNGTRETVDLNLSGADTRSLAGNVDIRPGDTIIVGKAGIVYVVGDVRLPGGFVMESSHSNQLTVLQALALAQGTNPTAALGSARVIRRTAKGPQDFALPLKKMLQAKAPDVILRAEDILFIPSSAFKSAARRSLDVAVQTASGVAIYRF